MMDVTKAPIEAMNNRKSLEAASTCGCFNCLKIFSPSEIVTWTDFGKTALCPECDRDMVLPNIDEATLSKIHDHWIPEEKKETDN